MLAAGKILPGEKGLFQHDSGAACSIVNDITLLAPESIQSVHKVFNTAAGGTMTAHHKGLIQIITNIGASFIAIPAYFVPSASANLLAGNDLDKLGYEQRISAGKIICTRRNKDHLVMNFLLDPARGAYYLRGRAKVHPPTQSVSLVSNSERPWHAVLGHPGKATFESMSQLYHEMGSPTVEACDTCAAAHLTKAASRAKVVKAIGYVEGDCLSADLLLYPTGLHGYTSACVIVDHTTNYCMLTIHKHKQILPAIKHAVQRCASVHGVKPRYIRMDLGTEFTGKPIQDWAHAEGISISHAAQGDHKQNGLVESHIRILKDVTRALLIEGGYPEKYWVYALQYAVQLVNLRPSRKSHFASRHEAFYGKGPPSISNLHVFGQIVFYHPNHTQSKLLARGRRGIYLGVDKEYRNALVMDLENRSVHIAREIYVSSTVTFPTVPKRQTVALDRATLTKSEIEAARNTADVNNTKRKYVRSGKYAKHNVQKQKATITLEPEAPAAKEAVPAGTQEPKAPAAADAVDETHAATTPTEVPVPAEPTPSTTAEAAPVRRSSRAAASAEPTPSTIAEAAPVRRSSREARVKYPFDNTDFGGVEQSINLLGPKGDQGHTYVPKTFNEAMRSNEAEIWKEVVATEYDAMLRHEVLDIVPRGAGDHVLAGFCLLNAKLDQNGDLDKRKARFAINGSSQIEGVDVHDTYSPVADMDSVRLLVGYAIKRGFEVSQADVKTAYYYGIAKERTVFHLPPGFVQYLSWPVSSSHGAQMQQLLTARKQEMLRKYTDVSKHHKAIGKALKGIPGSKDAGLLWFEQLSRFFLEQGFHQLKSSKCVFVKHDEEHGFAFVIAYVDDLIIAGEQIEWVHNALREKFDIKISALSWFLGINFSWNENKTSVKLTQRAFAQSILDEFNCKDINPSAVPLRSDAKLSMTDCPPQGQPTQFPLREFIGKVLYLARMSRPDIMLAVTVLSRFVQNPGLRHAQAAKVLLAYIAGTMDHGITLDASRSANELVAFADAEFANLDLDTRRSYGAFCIYFAGGPVAWNVARYPRVAGSTSVAEYYTLSRAGERVMWCRQILLELQSALYGKNHAAYLPPTPLYEDNATALGIANGICKQKHTKHVEIRYHIIQDYVQHGDIEVKKLAGTLMMVDAINKALGGSAHKSKAAYLLGTEDISELL